MIYSKPEHIWNSLCRWTIIKFIVCTKRCEGNMNLLQSLLEWIVGCSCRFHVRSSIILFFLWLNFLTHHNCPTLLGAKEYVHFWILNHTAVIMSLMFAVPAKTFVMCWLSCSLGPSSECTQTLLVTSVLNLLKSKTSQRQESTNYTYMLFETLHICFSWLNLFPPQWNNIHLST